MPENCPVCDTELTAPSSSTSTGGRDYSCPRCGKFRLTEEMIHFLPTQLSQLNGSRAKISHALRQAQEANGLPTLSLSTFERMLEVPFPRLREQVDLFIRWIAKTSDCPGEEVRFSTTEAESIVGARNRAGLKLILKYIGDESLAELGSISGSANRPHDYSARITFKGWEHFEQIQKGSVVYRKAFMAMKYGDQVLDNVFALVFKPSANQAGFDLIRQDQVHRAGIIDNLMRVEIQGADFLIADLTHGSPGAYWEAGYAEGLGKQVIYTCEKSVFEKNKTHFDTNHHHTILWGNDNLHAAGEALKATIRATLPHLARMSD